MRTNTPSFQPLPAHLIAVLGTTVVGGSSALNFMALTRGFKLEYDFWGMLNNDSGWNWASLLPYFKKSETFATPGSHSETTAPIAFDAFVHGTSGPITTSYPPFLATSFNGFYLALRSLGINVAPDMSGGQNAGVSLAPSSIDPATNTRVTSDAYLKAAILRPNLVVAMNCQVTKINWSTSPQRGQNVVASGISFVVVGTSLTLTATATNEVILSAGSIQSPQLLELSGVGNPSVMNPLGIKTVVSLTGVGENLQDHPATVNVYKLKAGVEPLDSLSTGSVALTEAVAQYALGQGPLTAALYPIAYLTGPQFLSRTDQTTAAGMLKAKSKGISAKQLAAQVALYLAGAPIVELLGINVYFGATAADADTAYVSLATCLQHSFSRGTVHITSSNPLTPPAINPNSQFLRKVAADPALAQYIDVETEPGPSVQTDAQWENWVEGDVRTEYHPVGTAAMLPRADGGVVSPSLVVYGTANVRVVDLSIVPIHVSAHVNPLSRIAIPSKADDASSLAAAKPCM
ncbi:hypothetical protein RQP46_010375 [Phenoliferia psychrophenolica]